VVLRKEVARKRWHQDERKVLARLARHPSTVEIPLSEPLPTTPLSTCNSQCGRRCTVYNRDHVSTKKELTRTSDVGVSQQLVPTVLLTARSERHLAPLRWAPVQKSKRGSSLNVQPQPQPPNLGKSSSSASSP
jgi:hypothetical protein